MRLLEELLFHGRKIKTTVAAGWVEGKHFENANCFKRSKRNGSSKDAESFFVADWYFAGISTISGSYQLERGPGCLECQGHSTRSCIWCEVLEELPCSENDDNWQHSITQISRPSSEMRTKTWHFFPILLHVHMCSTLLFLVEPF